MSDIVEVGTIYTSSAGETRKITGVGPQCSPGGKHGDWLSYVSSDAHKSGSCTIQEFFSWVKRSAARSATTPASTSDLPKPGPKPEPVATLDEVNTLRTARGYRLYIQSQYTNLLQQGLIPTQAVVLEQIKRLNEK